MRNDPGADRIRLTWARGSNRRSATLDLARRLNDRVRLLFVHRLRRARILVGARNPKDRKLSSYNHAAGFVLIDMLSLVLWGLAASRSPTEADASGKLSAYADAAAWSILFACLFQLVISRIFNAYAPADIFSLRRGLLRAAASFASTFAVLAIAELASRTMTVETQRWLALWGLSSLASVLGARLLVLSRARRLLDQGAFVRRAMSVGIFCDAVRPAEIAERTRRETRIISTVQLDRIGDLADLSDTIAHQEVDVVYIATPWHDIPAVMGALKRLRHLSTQVLVLPLHRVALDEVTRVTMFGDRITICANEEPIQGWSLWLKRVEDVALASAALIALSPLLLLVALLIRIDSPGPVIFRQPRTGFNGRTFALWKFRSMYHEMRDPHARVQTRRNDPRVTRVGLVIRRASIDELPQLINVLQGTMSIVGPRPHALATRTMGQNLEELVDYYAVRHRVKPGMTGWAQIHGYRGELDSLEKLQKRVDHDLFYIDNWTIWLDIRIVLSTVALIFQDSNAY